jgi:hypothetical protein
MVLGAVFQVLPVLRSFLFAQPEEAEASTTTNDGSVGREIDLAEPPR